MPINSVIITATPEEEQSKTYFIKTYDSTVFVKTTKSKINSLIDLISTIGVVGIEEWGEMSNFDDIYEF